MKSKTYTCDKCGKVGKSFLEMAEEICPKEINVTHRIFLLGDPQ